MATYEDLQRVPDHLVAQLIKGELLVSPRPAMRHGHVASVLGADLIGPFHRRPGGPRGPGGWWIIFEPELHLGRDVLVPDLAGWRRERLPAYPDTPWMSLAPDWVCEVLSPSTARTDRVRKPNVYARAGVRHIWMVDPAPRTLEVLRLEGSHYAIVATFAGEEVIHAEPFDAVPLDLARWWPEEADGAPEG